MKILAFILLHDAIEVFLLWIFYIAVMNLKRVNDATPITGFAYCIGWVVEKLGRLLDVYANIFIFTRYMLDIPREWTVSDRMIRYVKTGDGWRKTFAQWLCKTLLNDFDPSGCHCK